MTPLILRLPPKTISPARDHASERDPDQLTVCTFLNSEFV